MLENHQREQYFWREETVSYVADLATAFANPCCLCTPLLGEELERRGTLCATLDVDERFASLRGFEKFDVRSPRWQKSEFGAIWCDPPFWMVSLSELFKAIRLLARHDYTKPIAICYPTRRGTNLLRTFHRFGLKGTGYFPSYRTVNTEEGERNRIEFFANFVWGERGFLDQLPLS